MNKGREYYKQLSVDCKEKARPRLYHNSTELGTFEHRKRLYQILQMVMNNTGKIEEDFFDAYQDKFINRRAQIVFKKCYKIIQKRKASE